MCPHHESTVAGLDRHRNRVGRGPRHKHVPSYLVIRKPPAPGAAGAGTPRADCGEHHFMGFLDNLLWPIKWVVAWIMVRAHDVLTFLGMDPAGGWTWLLSIVALVIVIRILLIPLFVRQIKASRGMQVVQPEIQKLQKKYKGKTDPASRQAMQQEMMAIYKDAGTSPFASCLPLIAQMPVFFALYRVLYSLPALAQGNYHRGDSIGPMTQALAGQVESSTVFGAPLASSFMGDGATVAVRVVTAVLIVLMSATTLF